MENAKTVRCALDAALLCPDTESVNVVAVHTLQKLAGTPDGLREMGSDPAARAMLRELPSRFSHNQNIVNGCNMLLVLQDEVATLTKVRYFGKGVPGRVGP